jgi:hypothetical protein
MKKIIAVLLTFLFITNCGYTPIYSSKNFNFKIKNITKLTNDPLNSNIERKLKNFSDQSGEKIISLRVDAKEKINILLKNSKGNPSRYEMIISIKVEITHGLSETVNQSFEEKFNYNVNKNKFELKQYEKEIKDLLINKNINNIIIYLSKL